jgi:hypothetical protein
MTRDGDISSTCSRNLALTASSTVRHVQWLDRESRGNRPHDDNQTSRRQSRRAWNRQHSGDRIELRLLSTADGPTDPHSLLGRTPKTNSSTGRNWGFPTGSTTSRRRPGAAVVANTSSRRSRAPSWCRSSRSSSLPGGDAYRQATLRM